MTIDEPVGSGLSYFVTHTDGHQPDSLQDFAGDVQLTVTQNGAPTHLLGVGGEATDGVRFLRKGSRAPRPGHPDLVHHRHRRDLPGRATVRL